jgi:hypothetical protein
MFAEEGTEVTGVGGVPAEGLNIPSDISNERLDAIDGSGASGGADNDPDTDEDGDDDADTDESDDDADEDDETDDDSDDIESTENKSVE